jgi:hypothetical protein
MEDHSVMDSRTLDLFAPREESTRALMHRAGIEFALGHGSFSLGGSGCIAPLLNGLPGWRRLCARYSVRLHHVRGYMEPTA